MKKNISINISGIIFHIEEDGYENLQQYLDSINNYFSSYEESEEIIADIESRIAEIFLEKLTDGKQVVSAEDVSGLIATMGNTTDFEAIEEETDFASSTPEESAQSSTTGTTGTAQGQHTERTGSTSSAGTGAQDNTKRGLFRDLNNQILGGVASGLAHYMKVDSIWIRVLFLLLLPTGASFIAYVLLWIFVPGSDELVEHDSVKKLYRDPEDRVLGGVCSGLAKYLNIDIIIVRILFIVFLIGGGLSFIVYLVLWVITPEASSITDRMQMKGEKVTLSNIDENIKKKQTGEDFGPKDEGVFTKVILFPFRLVGKILSGLSKALAPLMLFIVAVIRIFTGVIISINGIAFMFSILVVAGVLLGLYQADDWFFYDTDPDAIIISMFMESVPWAGVVAALTLIFVPALFLTIAGITIIAKRRVMSNSFGWSLLGIWIIALLVALASVPQVVADFREEGSITTTEIVDVTGETLVLDIDDRFNYHRDNGFYIIDLDLRVSNDDQLRLESRVRSRGRTRTRAEENAGMIDYDYSVRDSVIVFDDMFQLKPNGEYRAQELEMTLYIPQGKPFEVKRGMQDLLGRFGRGIRWSDAYRNTWVYSEDGLDCLTCASDSGSGGSASTDITDDFRKVIDITNVHQLNLKDAFKVIVEKSDDERVIVESQFRRVRDVRAQVNNDQLEISGEGMTNRQTSDINVHIYVTDLDKVIAREKVDLEIRGFGRNDLIELIVRNDARVEVEGNLSTLDVMAEDKGRVTLLGEVEELIAELRDDSRLTALEAEITSAQLETYKDSSVRIKVKDYLRADAQGRSRVRYEGNPTLDIVNTSSAASVSAF